MIDEQDDRLAVVGASSILESPGSLGAPGTFAEQIAPHIARILGELESRLAYLPLPGASKRKRSRPPKVELSDFDRRYRVAKVRFQRLLEKSVNLDQAARLERVEQFEHRWSMKKAKEKNNGQPTADG